jgi:ElaB/YqjD/DUF883 family membrane-anchored ribosome-binding protein
MAQAMDTSRSRKNGHARGALKSRANDVLDDLSELRKDMSKLAEAANKVAHAEVRSAEHRLESFGRGLSTRANDSAEYMSQKVRTHPATSVGIAAGAGLLIGLLLSRR